MEYGLVAKDRKKNEITKRSEGAEHASTVMILDVPKLACEIAMLKTFNAVTYGVLRTLDIR